MDADTLLFSLHGIRGAAGNLALRRLAQRAGAPHFLTALQDLREVTRRQEWDEALLETVCRHLETEGRHPAMRPERYVYGVFVEAFPGAASHSSAGGR